MSEQNSEQEKESLEDRALKILSVRGNPHMNLPKYLKDVRRWLWEYSSRYGPTTGFSPQVREAMDDVVGQIKRVKEGIRRAILNAGTKFQLKMMVDQIGLKSKVDEGLDELMMLGRTLEFIQKDDTEYMDKTREHQIAQTSHRVSRQDEEAIARSRIERGAAPAPKRGGAPTE